MCLEDKQKCLFQTSAPIKLLCTGIVNMRHPRNKAHTDQIDTILHIKRFWNACELCINIYTCNFSLLITVYLIACISLMSGHCLEAATPFVGIIKKNQAVDHRLNLHVLLFMNEAQRLRANQMIHVVKQVTSSIVTPKKL